MSRSGASTASPLRSYTNGSKTKKSTPFQAKKNVLSELDRETGAGLAFLDAANAGQAAQAFLKGDLNGGLNTLSQAFKDRKQDMIKIGAGALAAKLVDLEDYKDTSEALTEQGQRLSIRTIRRMFSCTDRWFI